MNWLYVFVSVHHELGVFIVKQTELAIICLQLPLVRLSCLSYSTSLSVPFVNYYICAVPPYVQTRTLTRNIRYPI